MKKIIFVTYFAFVAILFILHLFSVLYEKKIHDNIYDKYLPEVRINPQYSIETREVTNKEEVTLWKDSDFVPWYGIASHETWYFIKCFGFFFIAFALLLYFPILLYNRKNIKILYWIIMAFELTICFYLWSLLYD